MTGSRPLEKVEDLRTNIEQTYNVKVIYLQADLNETDKAKWIVDETAKHFERLDILVNNAGIGDIHPIEDFPDETFEKILRVNFLSNWYTCKHAIPHMKRNNWGRIINISSLAGRNGFTNHSPYVSSKHAQIGLTKALALELA
jgi:3-hydroxybutyrate dehydrogenase